MKRYKKKRESFFSKIVNFTLTILIACAIGSQVCTAANNNLRIAQVSDAHFSSFEENTSYKFLKKSGELLDDVIFQINTSGPYDFVMFTGDLVNYPKISELQKFTSHVNNLIYPWYAIAGNHDISIDGPLTKDKFIATLAQANDNMNQKNIYYAFTPKKGFRVICLDSIIDYKLTANGEISNEEFIWLKEELDEHEKDTIIVCTHVPIIEPYSSSNHKMLNEYEVRKLLKTHKNPLIVLQGHYHCVKIRQDENMLVITSPSLVTYPNAFRVININSNKNRTLVDVYLKETNLKDIQTRSKLRLMGTEKLYGEECDRNASFELGRKD
ncbi:MAG: metallophosphoesterase [Candidatus Gastranaerophilaceae bacterium]